MTITREMLTDWAEMTPSAYYRAMMRMPKDWARAIDRFREGKRGNMLQVGRNWAFRRLVDLMREEVNR